MKYYLKLGLILFIFSVVASGILAFVNSLTTPIIAAKKAQDEIDAREKLIPGAVFEEHETVDGESYFIALDEDSEPLGFVFIASNGCPEILTMVKSTQISTSSAEILDQGETPGGLPGSRLHHQLQKSGRWSQSESRREITGAYHLAPLQLHRERKQPEIGAWSEQCFRN